MFIKNNNPRYNRNKKLKNFFNFSKCYKNNNHDIY